MWIGDDFFSLSLSPNSLFDLSRSIEMLVVLRAFLFSDCIAYFWIEHIQMHSIVDSINNNENTLF